jgi:DNA-binding beta-propeller fold protein YncE
MFGGLGGQLGRFFSPADIDVDAEGNLYVIDTTTKKLSKFESGGNVIASVDIRGEPGEESDPWGVTVLGDGRVAVADTFGWRVRIFSEDLEPLSSFGTAPTLDGSPGEYELFGPRDTAIDSRGRLWVTDTGHHRLMVYDADNVFVMQVGGEQGGEPGQLSEPVGIDISASGEVFVADMYNARVQILDIDGNYVGEFAVDGWGGSDPADKPYLDVLSDGRIALSLPLAGEVRIYSRDGTLESTLTAAEPLERPYGVVEAADGGLWVVEGDASRVRRFDIG